MNYKAQIDYEFEKFHQNNYAFQLFLNTFEYETNILARTRTSYMQDFVTFSKHK